VTCRVQLKYVARHGAVVATVAGGNEAEPDSGRSPSTRNAPLQPPALDSPFHLDRKTFNIGDGPSAENPSAAAPSMIPLESDAGPQEKAAANDQLHADDNAQPSPRESPQLSPTAAENDEDASRPAAPIQRRRVVTRACDGCRRKKIKCEGKQPCIYCTKCGYGTCCGGDQDSTIPFPLCWGLYKVLIIIAAA
jgi:pyruvate/2-oxoglutarate dehydrogenase complex dihydrolipoamide acyltransferase (E2) component